MIFLPLRGKTGSLLYDKPQKYPGKSDANALYVSVHRV